MAYREVTMIEVKEVLRRWKAGAKRKRIAAELGLDPKTVRRYIGAAIESGLERGNAALRDEEVVSVLAALRGEAVGRPPTEAWGRCEREREFIGHHLEHGVRLSKIAKLLRRRGVEMNYSMIYRYAVAELGFGKAAPTMPVADGEPGGEVQLDTGWMTHLETNPASGKRRRFRAWIFTPIENVLREAGAPIAGFRAHALGEGRRLHDDLQRAIFDAGIFGVPTYVTGGEVFFGREHLPRIRWLLTGRRGRPPDVAYRHFAPGDVA